MRRSIKMNGSDRHMNYMGLKEFEPNDATRDQAHESYNLLRELIIFYSTSNWNYV